MRIVRAVVGFSLLFLCALASAQVSSMKLRTPTAGWAASANRLFATTDGGTNWTEITPNEAKQETIASVFFLDTSRAWVLLSHYADPTPRFDLASTSDSGATWSVSRVVIPPMHPAGTHLATDGWMFFLDSAHGWINLTVEGSMVFHPGALLMTQDGGTTWNWVQKGAGSRGPVYFITANDGWIVSPEGSDPALYVTHDGSRSWQEVTLKSPPEASLGTRAMPTYDLPVFTDTKHGFLQVAYRDGTTGALVLFATSDGGQTWQFDRILPNLGEAASLVVDSSWVAASVSPDRGTLAFTTLPIAAGKSQLATVRWDAAKIGTLPGVAGLAGKSGELSFIDSQRGWVLANGLLSTADGGANWSDITPPQLKLTGSYAPVVVNVPSALLQSASAPRSTSNPGYSFASNPDLSIHLGFDRGQVLCGEHVACGTAQSVSYMQTWWNYSSYYDTSLYLPGASNHTNDPNLNINWVTAIQQQGWGLVPTWVGLQAPCACKALSGDYPNCATFSANFGFDPNAAYVYGTQEADSAIVNAQALGISGTIVYADIENYTPSTQCSPAVVAFLNGWVQEMHLNGFSAGVYGNPSPAQKDFSQALPLPDDIWVAKYDNGVTIWGLVTLSDSLWNNNQRMHQYRSGHPETWGGTPTFGIDNDINDAQIVAGFGTKIYNGFAFSNVDYPSAPNGTAARGISDIKTGGGLITASGQTGRIVGYAPPFGFLDVANTFTAINCAAGADTVALGINSKGQVVGTCYPASGSVYGYLRTPSGSFVTIQYPGALQTLATGINDASQIVGFWVDANAIEHGFFYNYGGNKQFTSFDVPQALFTEAWGINGSSQIVGRYQDSNYNWHAFLFNQGSDGSLISFDYPGWGYTGATGINNNGQVLGLANGTFLFDESSNGFSILPDDPNAPAGYTSGYGINDYGQIVGAYPTPTFDTVHGFLAVPQ